MTAVAIPVAGNHAIVPNEDLKILDFERAVASPPTAAARWLAPSQSSNGASELPADIGAGLLTPGQ
jgi:hypothetical protein